MWDNILKYVRQNKILKEKDRIMIGLSGGADSVCLLRFLMEASREYSLSLFAVHVNHMLRQEGAERDENFVKELCGYYGIDLLNYRVDVRQYALKEKCSFEEAGRKVRYEYFEKAAKEKECNKIALAHHENDLAETVIFRMIRGTGIFGLSAMAPVNGRFIRPLLGTTREEIVTILGKLGQDYMEDETNQENVYSRNYIRNIIMPEFTGVNAKAASHIARLAGEVRELEEYVKPAREEAFDACIKKDKDQVILDLSAYKKYPLYLQKNILRESIFEASNHKKDIGAIHIELMEELIRAQTGKQISLPYEIIARKEEGRIRLGKVTKNLRTKDFREEEEEKLFVSREMLKRGDVVLNCDQSRITFSFVPAETVDYQNNDCVKYFDYDKIKDSMCIRHKKDGDYFIMDKMNHKKALRRYFIDEKIPSDQRQKRWLLADGAHIMWVIGGRMSEAYKVTKNTKCVLKVGIAHIH